MTKRDRNIFKFEVCANGVESCMAAQQGGADRVELCAGIPEGGTTPSYGEMLVARRILTHTRLNVIIRPRGGDFLYTPLELERMAADIDIAKQLGADGVVFGCLTKDGDIDNEANLMLMRHAEGMSVTFHRAFDRCKNPSEALEKLIEMRFDRILTSGQKPKAEEGTELLRKLNKQADGRIILLAGSGVNEENIADIHNATGINEFHFSARIKQPSGMDFINKAVYMGNKDADEGSIDVTSAERVRKTISKLINI